MNQIIKIILLLSFIKVNSQNSNIQLPNGYGFDFKYSDTSITPIFSIYITKEGKTSFEHISLPIEKLGDTIFKFR